MALHIGMVTIDCADPRRLARFWSAALDVGAVFESDEFVLLAPAGEGEPTLGLQRVPEDKVTKNRVHLDLRADDRPAEVARLVAIGATDRGTTSSPSASRATAPPTAASTRCPACAGPC